MNLLLAFLEDRRLGVAAMGALAIVTGSILPWIHVPQPLIGPATGYGYQDEGKITILLGVAALGLLLALARLRARDLAVGAVLAGLAAAGLAISYVLRPEEAAARVIARTLSGGSAPLDPSAVVPFPSRIGVGVWVVVAGAAVLVVSCAILILRGVGTSEPANRSRP